MRRFAMKRGARSLPLLTAEQFHRISRAVSDNTRYDILRKVFASSGLTCGGAAEGLPISAATVSHHLRQLFDAGLVDCGPVSGFDADKLNAEFFPDGKWKVNLLCNLGYGDTSKLYPRNPRLNFEEAAVIL